MRSLEHRCSSDNCVPHVLQVLNAARKMELHVFFALHHRYHSGDCETCEDITPIQKAGWRSKAFENGTWGGDPQRIRTSTGRCRGRRTLVFQRLCQYGPKHHMSDFAST